MNMTKTCRKFQIGIEKLAIKQVYHVCVWPDGKMIEKINSKK